MDVICPHRMRLPVKAEEEVRFTRRVPNHRKPAQPHVGTRKRNALQSGSSAIFTCADLTARAPVEETVLV